MNTRLCIVNSEALNFHDNTKKIHINSKEDTTLVMAVLSFISISHRCNSGSDNTLVYQCDPTSAIQDFDLNAFRILNSSNNLVFYFCDVIVCLNNANGSICEDRCDNCTVQGVGGIGRKRRSLEENGYDSGSNTYSLAVGPFSVKEQDDGEGLKISINLFCCRTVN